MAWFECVPNFSEGRDADLVAGIAGAARTGRAVAVLDVHSDADHNRTVVTLAGEGDALVEAVMAMMRVATAGIDLNRQRGVHPRMGATDVVPFVPLGDATTDEAVELAVALGTRVWRELRIPVYLYAQAARVAERQDLAAVRAGQFEGIRMSIGTDPARHPDIGEARLHPTAGAVAIGARPLLVAYNAFLDTPDVNVARRVAAAVRGRDGGLDEVKALGFAIEGRGRAQVSMNLTDYRRTPPHVALEAVRREAAAAGAAVEETEIVGLVPEDALFDAAGSVLQLDRPAGSVVLERKLRAAQAPAESLAAFAAHLAARAPTPAGGSAAAAAGALGAALGEMVAASLPVGAGPHPAVHVLGSARSRLLALVEEDARAYDASLAARKAARDRTDAGCAAEYAATLGRATDVPLETARLARACAGRLRALDDAVRPVLRADWTTALALLNASFEGAMASAVANLDELREQGCDVDGYEQAVAELREP